MRESVFSPREELILKTLGKRKLTIMQIAGRTAIDNNAVAGSVRRINLKCWRHDFPWNLNGMGAGRAGKLIWKDKR